MIKRISLLLTAALLAVLGVGSPALATVTYYHVQGAQGFTTGTIPDYAKGNFTVWNPSVNSGDHSLGELLVRDASTDNVVEVMWRKTSSDSAPHLAIYWWKNGVGCGYNGVTGCSVTTPWVDNAAATLHPGDTLNASTGTTTPITIKFTIAYSTTDCGTAPNGWWIQAYYSTGTAQYIGCYKDTNWSGVSPTFNNIHNVAAYGEVALTGVTPTTQMGSGVCPAAVPVFNTTAFIGSVQTGVGVGAPTLATLTYTDTDATKYAHKDVSTSSFYYGGDYSCP